MKNIVEQTRKMRGLTVKELAEKANITGQSLYNIESGKQIPNGVTTLRLARLLKINVYELFLID